MYINIYVYIIFYYIILYYIVLNCIILYYIILYCIVLYCIILYIIIYHYLRGEGTLCVCEEHSSDFSNLKWDLVWFSDLCIRRLFQAPESVFLQFSCFFTVFLAAKMIFQDWNPPRFHTFSSGEAGWAQIMDVERLMKICVGVFLGQKVSPFFWERV